MELVSLEVGFYDVLTEKDFDHLRAERASHSEIADRNLLTDCQLVLRWIDFFVHISVGEFEYSSFASESTARKDCLSLQAFSIDASTSDHNEAPRFSRKDLETVGLVF